MDINRISIRMCGPNGIDDSKTLVSVPLIIKKWEKKCMPKSKPYLGICCNDTHRYRT